MDSKWNASMMIDNSKPPSESEGGTIVEDAVGLLNIYEYQNCKEYLNNILSWALISQSNSLNVSNVNNDGNTQPISSTNFFGIRPSINLKSEIKIVFGNGTEANPYRLEGDNDTNLEGTHLNTRYSGEYISFGTGETNLYRIVSHETEGLTKITSAEPLKENGTFKTLAFGDSIYYSNSNTIGSFLNGEYLTSGSYLTSEQANMIEDDTAWYLGTVGSGASYRLAKYIDTNMTSITKSVTAKVGLLRLGELMSGQFNSSSNNSTYWLLTLYNSSNILSVYNRGVASNADLWPSFAIKPALNLKENVIITSGDGTLQNPFEIELAS